jgi:hypothetical protein
MRNPFMGVIVGLAAALVLSSAASAQMAQPKQGDQAKSPWKFYPTDRPVGDGGPAPKRDLTGTWAGPSSGMAVPKGDNVQDPTAPPLTPLGQQIFAQNKPIGKYSPGGTNDPHTRYCDPFGFPQNMTNEIRGMTIASSPNRTFIMIQYMDLWREIWTDGRSLPKGVGAATPGALDPKYNGYSIGHWEDDYTFVVQTTGLDDSTWATKNGYPHSIDAVVTERFTRVDKNDLSLSITMEDPTLYTKPFVIGTSHFRWVPNQQLDDFTCIPSQVQEYIQQMADPALHGQQSK